MALILGGVTWSEIDRLAQEVGQAEKKKNGKKKNNKNASVFPNWKKFAVHQRRPQTGCIPTGYEMILRAAKVKQVDFTTFQDDFDLDKQLGKGQTAPRNNFVSVAEAIRKKHPNIVFEQQVFETGADKIAFIDKQLKTRKPLLVSVAVVQDGQLRGWHIMPIVDAKSSRYCLLQFVEANGEARIQWISKQQLADLHDQYEGGKDVAYLKNN